MTSSFKGEPDDVRRVAALIQGSMRHDCHLCRAHATLRFMLKGTVLVTFAALATAEFVRGIGLVAAGALTYGLLGGVLPPEGGFDRSIAIASFVTIALGAADLLFSALFAATVIRLRALNLPPDRPVNLQAGWSAALSLLLIVAGNPLAPQITMLALASVAAASLRLIRDERGRNG